MQKKSYYYLNNYILFILLFITACTDKSPTTINLPDQNITSPTDIIVPDAAVDVESIEQTLIDNSCPEGMKLIEGNWCPNLQEKCLKWRDQEKIEKWNSTHSDKKKYVVCEEFEASSKCLSKTVRHLKFCMDIFERPNSFGTLPEIMISFNDLDKECKKEGKRLCSDVEFQKACQGPDNFPYPYGFTRNNETCNTDRKAINWDQEKIKHKDKQEVKKLDQRVASGSTQCVSDYGIYDLVGNTDEFVLNTLNNFKPYKSAMVGGHWIKGARNRCLARTLVHNENFFIYEAGGRCCKDT